MKLKPTIKSFIRRNKKCAGMYCLFIQLIFLLVPPYDNVTTVLFLFLCVFHLRIWQLERREQTLMRHNDYRIHKVIIRTRAIYHDLMEDIVKHPEKYREMDE